MKRIYAAAMVSIAVMMLSLLSVSVEAADPVTFTKDVAPIMFKNCASCHRPGEVAPMSLVSYKDARPWAKSIAKEVSQRSMPPWSGESDHQKWINDISLTQDEIDTIVAWATQGALQGDPADMPATPTFPTGWTLGEPDYIITLDPVDVPADGDDLFVKQRHTIDIDENKWIRAIEFLIGDRRVAHHSMFTYNNHFDEGQMAGSTASNFGILAIWTAGMPPFVFPEGMGRVVSPNTKITADLHYHPFGEATTDQTLIGLYFGEGELKKEVSTITVANTGIRIPPGAPAHAELAFHIFDRDMKIVAFSPHMHLRGKSMRYDITYPDGRKEVLLDVPNFNYNWQWQYYPTEPIDAPKGSRLDVTAVWDNSAGNKANPDPSQEIIYRGNTFNEMFVGFFEAIPAEGVYHKPTPVRDRLMDMLAEHPAEDSYYVGGFLPFGLYVPKEGEGWMYLAQGLVTFTISLDDFEWDGDHLKVTTQISTPEASATTTTIEWDRDETGALKGKFSYGSDTERPLTIPIKPTPLGAPKLEVSQL